MYGNSSSSCKCWRCLMVLLGVTLVGFVEKVVKWVDTASAVGKEVS